MREMVERCGGVAGEGRRKKEERRRKESSRLKVVGSRLKVNEADSEL